MVKIVDSRAHSDEDSERIEYRVLASVVKCMYLSDLVKQRLFLLRPFKLLISPRRGADVDNSVRVIIIVLQRDFQTFNVLEVWSPLLEQASDKCICILLPTMKHP